MRFPIGTQFVRIGSKSGAVETVTDYHVTRNLAGDMVRARYVATHKRMGQTITDSDVAETTIARGLLSHPVSMS